jgi:hypothetical protein
MPNKIRDPLLGGAKLIAALMVALCIFAASMVAIGLGAVATVERGRIIAELQAVGAPPFGIWLIVAALLLIIALMAMGGVFFVRLLAVVNSVGKGDPFDPANADRLAQMGWLALGGQVLILPLMGLAEWFAPYLEKAGEGSDLGLDFDIGGILLILVLFILARVFRHGAAMREDLEGTV